MHLKCCILECMIRRHRHHLVKELWRARATLGTVYTTSEVNGSGHRQPTGCGVTRSAHTADAEMQLKSAFHNLLKRLDVEELEALLDSVRTRGFSTASSASNKCILLPQAHKSQSEPNLTTLPVVSSASTSDTAAHRLLCRVFRWNDLSHLDLLKPNPLCQGCSNSVKSAAQCDSCPGSGRYTCINPYHWSRVVQTDSRLPCEDLTLPDVKPSGGIEDLNDNELYDTKTKCDISSSATTTETETGKSEQVSDYWCKVGYWELSERVGQLFPVIPNHIDIFQDIPDGSGISLSILHKNHRPRTEKVSAVRSKIGAGVTLSLEGDKVWLYNRSASPVFTSSFSLNANNFYGDSWRVFKVNPGHAIVVYDYSIMATWSLEAYRFSDGPVDPHSIQVSFVKGWGRDYHRQSIISCDCWLEVLLNVSR